MVRSNGTTTSLRTSKAMTTVLVAVIVMFYISEYGMAFTTTTTPTIMTYRSSKLTVSTTSCSSVHRHRQRYRFSSMSHPPFSLNPSSKASSSSFKHSSTHLSMYNNNNRFNLPPGGGGGNNNDDLLAIIRPALTVALMIGFFLSPIGGFVLGIFNSFLILIFVLPLALQFVYSIWMSVNTISAPCPSCGYTNTVMKQPKKSSRGGDGATDVYLDDAGFFSDTQQLPTMCPNCGALLRANADNTGIDNVSGRTTIDDLDVSTNSLFDFFFSSTTPSSSSSSSSSTSSGNINSSSRNNNQRNNKRGESVIDVDVIVNDDD